MKKRLVALLVCTTMLLGLAAGCGKQDSGTSETETTVSETAEAEETAEAKEGEESEETAALEPVTLSLGLPNGYDLTPKAIIDNFQALHPEITLEIDDTPWNDFKKKVKLQATSGDAPDIFVTDSGFVATMGGMGQVVDLSDFLNERINTEEYESTLFSGQDSEGHVWGIPQGFSPIAMIYNPALFEEAGLDVPDETWTYDDMFEAAKLLTKDLDGDGETDQYGLLYGKNSTMGWVPFMVATGGMPTDESGTVSMIKDEKTIEAIRKYSEPSWEGFTPSTEWTAANGGAESFVAGKIAMYILTYSSISAIENMKPEGFVYDAVIMPYGWSGVRPCIYVPNLWVISESAGEAERAAAYAFLEYYLSEEAQNILVDEFIAGMPTKLTAIEYLGQKEFPISNMKAFWEGLDEHGHTIFECATYERWSTTITERTLEIRNGLVDFDEGIEALDKELTEILEDQ